jgi:hypothetical protein
MFVFFFFRASHLTWRAKKMLNLYDGHLSLTKSCPLNYIIEIYDQLAIKNHVTFSGHEL